MNLLKDFRDLFIPYRCLHCKTVISQNHQFLCAFCYLKLEQTHFLNYKDNPLEKLFWGHVEIHQATALYFYRKKSPIQTLLKELKYNSLTSFGLHAAKTIISEIKMYHSFNHVDIVTIIPLHPKKEKKRGYNQVELFANTIANYLQKPFYKDLIIKKENTKSQTIHNKEIRFKNVKNTFEKNANYKLNNKHVLLIDDVLTTGATLISCCKTLKNTSNVNISIITIACVV